MAYDEELRRNAVSRSDLLCSLNFVKPDEYFQEDTWEKEQVPSGKTSRFLHVDKRQDRFKRPWRARYSDNEGRRRNKGFETELEAARFADRKRVELWEAQSDQRRLPRTNFDYRGYLKGGDAAAGAPTKQGHGTEMQHSSGSQGDG